MKPQAKIGFVSLGCSKNAVDCERMISRVHEAGYEVVADETLADVIVVNTCAFIQSAKEEAIETILDLNWLKENRSLRAIIVTGCLAQRYYEEILTQLPEADAVLALGGEAQIVEAIEAVLSGKRYDRHGDPEELLLSGDRVLTTGAGYAYLKIADGCDNRCSFCAIPAIRGAFRSRPIEELVEEAKTLFALGVRELILIAQDTTRYGLDLYGRYALSELLEALCGTPGLDFTWIRLMYCYPDKITDELLDVMVKHKRIARYLDLPIQHASDRILRSMHRHGDLALIEDAIARLRRAMPDIVIRTTVMVGFPGETEEDYQTLRAFLRKTRFERLGCFAYSAEEGTPAASYPDQIDEKTKQSRLDNLMQEQYTIHSASNKRFLGQTLDVLCEGYDPPAGCYYGRSEYLAPEVDGYVFFTSAKKLSEGELVKVKIEEMIEYDLSGTAVF